MTPHAVRESVSANVRKGETKVSRSASRAARWGRRVGVLLGCGVVTTLLISATTAFWAEEDSSWRNLEFQTDDEPQRQIVNWRGQAFSLEMVPGTAPSECWLATPVRSDDPAEARSYWYNGTPAPIQGSWPIHIDERDAFMSWSSKWYVLPGLLYEVRSGWPVAAMRSRRVTNWDDEKFTNVTQCDGLEIPASGLGERLRFTLEGNSLNSPYRPVPLVPVWPGFAVCSVFWAGVVGVVWYVPGMVRGAMRQRKGLCGRCGYEVRGLASCPECGHAHGDGKQIGLGAQRPVEVTT